MPSFCLILGCANDTERDAQALVFAECLKRSQVKVNRANFSTDRRTKWVAVICTENMIELSLFAVYFHFGEATYMRNDFFKSRLSSEHKKIKNSDTTEKQQQQRALSITEKRKCGRVQRTGSNKNDVVEDC